MLDEPLGSLDRTIRERLITELRDILKNACQTVLYVTHDQEEAFTIADRVAILGAGNISQVGTPREIYQKPNSPYVARFLGMTNLLEANARKNQDKTMLTTDLGNWEIDEDYQGKGLLLIRSDQASLKAQGLKKPVSLRGTLVSSSFSGSSQQVNIQVNESTLKFLINDPDLPLPPPGEQLSIWFSPDESLQFFPDQ
jgi:ABC-type Fe3+/spermidine/putrescine transport system ATPase subunit